MNRMIETVMVTFLGGLLFTVLHVPLSWMLGPMTAALLWNQFTRRPLKWPVWLRNGGLMILGLHMGLTFTMESMKQISTQLPYMLISTLLTILFSLLMAFLTSRHAGISASSGAIGSIPGGLSQMVVLSEEIDGADAAVVTFMQTIRLLLVIFIVPFLVVHGMSGGAAGSVTGAVDIEMSVSLWDSLLAWGEAAAERPLLSLLLAASAGAAAWFAVKMRFPTPYLLGPLIVSAVFTVTGTEPPELPSLFVLAAQWGIGAYMGNGMKLSSLQNWKRLLSFTVISNAALIGFMLGLSWIFSLILPMSLTTAFLAMAPGGMAEMGVTAAFVGADVSSVVSYQLFRILFILFIVPYFLRRIFRRFHTEASAHPDAKL